MTTASMLDDLREAGLLFEAEMTDKSRDWLRRRGIDPGLAVEETQGEWAGDLVECVSAIDR